MADLKVELSASAGTVGVSSGSLQTGADGAAKPSDVSKTLLKQIEYYFSNNNLWRDQFLLNEIAKDPEGWVPISLVAEFSRIKSLSSDLLQICSALRQSKKLELSRDLFKVRRIHVVPPYNPKKDAKRTIYVDKLPPGSTLKSVRKLFSKFGRVTYVTKVNPLGEAVTPQTDVREAPPQEVSNTAEITTALVEFAKKEAAKKAITMIQAHNIKKGIIFPATPTASGSTPVPTSGTNTITLLSSPGTPSSQPTVEPPFEIKALEFQNIQKGGSKSSSPGGSPVLDFKVKTTTGGGSPGSSPTTAVTQSSFVTVTPATVPKTGATSPPSPPIKETQSAPSSVSSSPATSPPVASHASTPPATSTHHHLHHHGTGSSPPKSTLSPHASPFIPSTPSTASTSVGSSPAFTPTHTRVVGDTFTPSASPSPGGSPAGSSPGSTPGGGSSNSPSTPPNGGISTNNNSPPKEIDINLYTGFHILTKMSYLKKLSQLCPQDGLLPVETKKVIAGGGKQSPFRFSNQKPSPRASFNQYHDDDGSQTKRGHHRSQSNPYPSTYPPTPPPGSTPKNTGGRATPDRGGRATPDRGGRATPDRGRATPDRGPLLSPDRSSAGRITPDRSGRLTPDRGYDRDRDRDRERDRERDRDRDRGGRTTPDRSRNFLMPRPGSGSGHRDRSNSGTTFATSPRALPPRSSTPQSSIREESGSGESGGRNRSGSADQPTDYYRLKYSEEKQRAEQLEKKLQKLLGALPADYPVSPDKGVGGSPRNSPKSSPQKSRRRAKSSDIGGDKSERGYTAPADEQTRPKLKLLSSRLSSSGVSIAQRFAQGPDETGGFLGGRGAGRGRGAPATSASTSS